MESVLLFVGTVVAVWAVIVAVCAASLRRVWNEPVLRFPIVIIESDDWGAGPQEQTAALRRLRELLEPLRDEAGRSAVMTLGLVLGIADTAAMRAGGDPPYRRRDLAHPAYANILMELRAGIAAGVFAPQLHGLEHYWPSALLAAVQGDAGVRDWLAQDELRTETLPDALQSRWIDGSRLPSRPLEPAMLEAPICEEVALFAQLFGLAARVAVPNTFVWTHAVERAWAVAGVRFVVTPGTRFESRDGRGQLLAAETSILNGQPAGRGITYLVRDVYFEPARGHLPDNALAEMRTRAELGRPALIESHRFNYLGQQAKASLESLQLLLCSVLRQFPRLRFMSTQELGEGLVAGDPALVESRPLARFPVWVRRVLALPRFARLARLSGLELLLRLSASTVSLFNSLTRGRA